MHRLVRPPALFQDSPQPTASMGRWTMGLCVKWCTNLSEPCAAWPRGGVSKSSEEDQMWHDPGSTHDVRRIRRRCLRNHEGQCRCGSRAFSTQRPRKLVQAVPSSGIWGDLSGFPARSGGIGRTRAGKHLRSAGMAFWFVPELGGCLRRNVIRRNPLFPRELRGFRRNGFRQSGWGRMRARTPDNSI